MALIFLTLFFLSPLTAAESPFCKKEVLLRQAVCDTKHFWIVADYAPITPGHLLVVPKNGSIHVLSELPHDFYLEFAETVSKVTNAFKEVLGTDQYILLEKNGKAAGQSVNHLHFHFIPITSTTSRWIGQTKIFFRIMWGASPLSEEELKEEVERYRSYFAWTPPKEFLQ